jgi:hypothetical protein
MDLAFVIPAAFITSVGLLRRAPWATKLTYAVAAFLTLEVGAVAGMSIAMTLRDDPAADPALLVVTVVSTLALAAVYARLLQVAQRAGTAGPDGERARAVSRDRARSPGQRAGDGERRFAGEASAPDKRGAG